VHDALIATLAACGPCRFERLAELLRAREARLRRQLAALWDGDLVSVDGSTYRLTDRGRARARTLRGNERRFEGLIRARSHSQTIDRSALTTRYHRPIMGA
jgi:hypothetical protein